MSKNIDVRMAKVEMVIMACLDAAKEAGYGQEWLIHWTLGNSLEKALKRVNLTEEEYVSYTQHIGYEESYYWLLEVYDKWWSKWNK